MMTSSSLVTGRGEAAFVAVHLRYVVSSYLSADAASQSQSTIQVTSHASTTPGFKGQGASAACPLLLEKYTLLLLL